MEMAYAPATPARLLVVRSGRLVTRVRTQAFRTSAPTRQPVLSISPAALRLGRRATSAWRTNLRVRHSRPQRQRQHLRPRPLRRKLTSQLLEVCGRDITPPLLWPLTLGRRNSPLPS